MDYLSVMDVSYTAEYWHSWSDYEKKGIGCNIANNLKKTLCSQIITTSATLSLLSHLSHLNKTGQ